MAISSAQLKGKIKNLAKDKNADARVLLRLFAMERFLERLSDSKYRNNFVIKGGVLVTAMVGVSNRSTMDIDASIKNLNISVQDARRFLSEIAQIDLQDGVSFELIKVERIMDEMEYPGLRAHMNAALDGIKVSLKIDISTGDVITPRAIEFHYPLMLEDREISLYSYNLETILGEKIQTILARGILNTRMRDFYDVHLLLLKYSDRLDFDLFSEAFAATCKKRNTVGIIRQAGKIIERIKSDEHMQGLWKAYQAKYTYAASISFDDTIDSVEELIKRL